MDLQLTDKLALVTGSTAGIGHAIAIALANEGAGVIINGRTEQAVVEVVAAMKADTGNDKIYPFAGDMGTAEAALAVAEQYPDVSILVNSLGIFEAKAFEDIPDEDWMRFFEVNVLSGVRLARAYLPAMKRENWGRIIFISSESAVQIPAEMVHYGVTKTAQLGVSRGIAETIAGTGITVNSVLPGPTKSRGLVGFVDEMAEQLGQTFEQVEQNFIKEARPSSLIKRFANLEEVASMVAYIASPLASATNGAALRVDGGVIKSAF
ncbi:MAG: SDR family oxidoreductase [Immundisolibacteraceae bacterium]|nr:SDR family oxidoreductase [Immundisolibacteraceae bacterium]